MSAYSPLFVRLSRIAVAVLGLAAVVATQVVTQTPPRTPIGPILRAAADWSCGDAYYVDPASGSDANAGTFVAPWRTITHAVPAALSQSAQGNPITINLRAGSYSAPNESYPIKLPARGIKLQAYEPGVTIFGEPWSVTLQVTRKGQHKGPCGTTPDTVIRGLTLRDGFVGIEIDTSIAGNPASTPDRVRIQRCALVHNTKFGISIITGSDRRSQHVIEDNEIAFNADFHGFGWGIKAIHMGQSSCLIRNNNIHDNEVGIEISGTMNNEGQVRPRIVSNFVRDAEWGISLGQCSSYLVNNTQAYGRPYSNGVTVYGVILLGEGDHVVANNIMWNPPSYAAPEPVFDYDLSNLVGTTVEATNYILSAVGIGNPPEFVAPPTDLHLKSISPLLDAGTNSFVLPEIKLTAGSFTARADVSADVDGDSRVLDFAQDGSADVEIGADERNDGSGAAVRLSSPNADQFGNVITGGAQTTVTLELTAKRSHLCSVYLWLPSGDDPITKNVFQSPFGNWRIMTTAPHGTNIGFGPANSMGVFSVNVRLAPAILGLERQVYVQAVTADPITSHGTISNRLLLEVNQ